MTAGSVFKLKTGTSQDQTQNESVEELIYSGKFIPEELRRTKTRTHTDQCDRLITLVKNKHVSKLDAGNRLWIAFQYVQGQIKKRDKEYIEEGPQILKMIQSTVIQIEDLKVVQ